MVTPAAPAPPARSSCTQPVKGPHRCQVPGWHRMHICRCGVIWNRDGLTAREWREG